MSIIYLILYSRVNVPINKSYNYTEIPLIKKNSFVSNFYKFDIKKVTALDSVIIFPVNSLNMNKNTFGPVPSSHGVNNSELSTCNSESEFLGTVVNSDCFNDYDPSLLGNVHT